MKKHTRTAHHETVSEHARALVAATAHVADEKVSAAREKLTQVMENAKEAIEYVEEKAIATAKETDVFIREKPYQAVGLAIGVGALIGFCIARRK